MAALCIRAGVYCGANPAPSYLQRTKPQVCRRRALHPSSGSPRSRCWQMTFLTMSKKFTQAVREEDIARGPGKRACTHHPTIAEDAVRKELEVNRIDWRPGKRPRTANQDQGPHTPTHPQTATGGAVGGWWALLFGEAQGMPLIQNGHKTYIRTCIHAHMYTRIHDLERFDIEIQSFPCCCLNTSTFEILNSIDV